MMRNSRLNKSLLTVLFIFVCKFQAFANEVKILSPNGGFTTKQTQIVKGFVPNSLKRITITVNGIPQDVPVFNGRFKVSIVVSPGLNLIELNTKYGRDKVSFFAKVPKRDIKMVLTWDNARYVDLWVTDPKGEKCYWHHPWTSSGGNIIVNDETGFGPQIFTMQKAIKGNYTVQVQYYSPGKFPITRIKLYIVLYEGTPREKRKVYQFTMTTPHQVYHITDLNIANE